MIDYAKPLHNPALTSAPPTHPERRHSPPSPWTVQSLNGRSQARVRSMGLIPDRADATAVSLHDCLPPSSTSFFCLRAQEEVAVLRAALAAERSGRQLAERMLAAAESQLAEERRQWQVWAPLDIGLLCRHRGERYL
eukprot:1176577-Prorocentrum_minimum.AAC.4